MQNHPRKPQFSSRPESSNANVTAAVGMEETVGHVRIRRNSLFVHTILWITGLVCAALFLATCTQAWSNSQLIQKVQIARQSLQKLQSEHHYLERQIQHYKDPATIESEARQRMEYVRPGEQAVVVINVDSQKHIHVQLQRNREQSQGSWQDWWSMFFG
jgi:cell division protein FtsB